MPSSPAKPPLEAPLGLERIRGGENAGAHGLDHIDRFNFQRCDFPDRVKGVSSEALLETVRGAVGDRQVEAVQGGAELVGPQHSLHQSSESGSALITEVSAATDKRSPSAWSQ